MRATSTWLAAMLYAAALLALLSGAHAARAGAVWSSRWHAPTAGVGVDDAPGINHTNPFWPHYPADGGSQRRLTRLDGVWEFGFSSDADPLTVTPSQVTTPDRQVVPGCFDIQPPGVEGRRGTAFYRRMLPAMPAGAPSAIHFMACSFYCRVFVDGVPLGEHRASGYNPFWIAVPPATSSAPRELFVVVNNQFNSTTAPTHTGGDFYNYGGITRNVILHQLPSSAYHLQRVETRTLTIYPRRTISVSLALGTPAVATPGGVPIEPTKPAPAVCAAASTADTCTQAGGGGECVWCTSSAFAPACYGAAFASGLAKPVFQCDGGDSGSDTSRVAQSLPDAVTVTLTWGNGTAGAPLTVHRGSDGVYALPPQQVPDTSDGSPAALWSLHDPALHTLTVSLLSGAAGLRHTTTPGASATVLDAIQVRFGLRIVSASTDTASGRARLALNGVVTKFHGVNRHTMWPDTGSALTLAQVQADVALLQKLGANYVRGAHYPQDQRYLDLCDEVGIVMWEETLGPGVQLSNLQSPYFIKYQLDAVNEMLDASYNHPSVILHAFYNEGPNDTPAACPGYNASAAVIRARTGTPPSRLVTWANNHLSGDKCIAIEDVVSFNDYPAWYSHPGDLNYIDEFWQQQVDWVDANWPDKPFTISETGAGGVFEWTNSSDPRWSQGYEAEVVVRDAKFAVGNVNVSGITVWQFNDIKANTQDTALCGSCDYLPHPPTLADPWTCAYINVSCGRPGGENHKGQVDFWRRTKASFEALQSAYAP